MGVASGVAMTVEGEKRGGDGVGEMGGVAEDSVEAGETGKKMEGEERGDAEAGVARGTDARGSEAKGEDDAGMEEKRGEGVWRGT